MNNNQIMNVVKGAAVGLIAGVAGGVAGKKMVDENPKMRKKANRAMQTFGSLIETAQYMLK